jgi:hypothetical protein
VARSSANYSVVQLHEATTSDGGVAVPPAMRPDEGTNATPVAAARASSSGLRGMRPSAQGLIPAGLDQLSPLLVGAKEQVRPATQSVTPVQPAASGGLAAHEALRASASISSEGQVALRPEPAGELLADAIKRVALSAAATLVSTSSPPPLRSWSRSGARRPTASSRWRRQNWR